MGIIGRSNTCTIELEEPHVHVATGRFRGMPDWLTIPQAAAYLSVTRNTIYRYCDLGLLPYYELRTGRGRRFKREDLDALLLKGEPRGGDHGEGQTRSR